MLLVRVVALVPFEMYLKRARNKNQSFGQDLRHCLKSKILVRIPDNVENPNC